MKQDFVIVWTCVSCDVTEVFNGINRCQQNSQTYHPHANIRASHTQNKSIQVVTHKRTLHAYWHVLLLRGWVSTERYLQRFKLSSEIAQGLATVVPAAASRKSFQFSLFRHAGRLDCGMSHTAFFCSITYRLQTGCTHPSYIYLPAVGWMFCWLFIALRCSLLLSAYTYAVYMNVCTYWSFNFRFRFNANTTSKANNQLTSWETSRTKSAKTQASSKLPTSNFWTHSNSFIVPHALLPVRQQVPMLQGQTAKQTKQIGVCIHRWWFCRFYSFPYNVLRKAIDCFSLCVFFCFPCSWITAYCGVPIGFRAPITSFKIAPSAVLLPLFDSLLPFTQQNSTFY